MIQGCEIPYSSHITTVAKKTFKVKVPQVSAETVIADFTITERGKVKSNLLFFTQPKSMAYNFHRSLHAYKEEWYQQRKIDYGL